MVGGKPLFDVPATLHTHSLTANEKTLAVRDVTFCKEAICSGMMDRAQSGLKKSQ